MKNNRNQSSNRAFRVNSTVFGCPSVEVRKKERRFELAFEGLRYYDLLRWGTAEAEINKKSNLTVKNDNKSALYTTKFRPETKGFLPIPESQIQLSKGVLVQNDGWK